MKKFIFLLLSACAVIGSRAQQPFAGTWEGKLNVGVELRLVFHIHPAGAGGWSATADSPDQSAFGMKCDTVIVSADSIRIEMRGINAAFAGQLLADTAISGTFSQGMTFPLLLKKVDKPTTRKRPQLPQPPFPYRSEDVEYGNADKTLRYGGTLTIPPGSGPFPAVLLITGSGAQDRDETLLGHKPFALLADALTRNGYMVLRVDDRGTGKTTGNFALATSADFADDAAASLDYLLSRPETDKAKTGMIGHSEGAMIAPMVAAGRKDISFIVLMAGPGVPITELLAEQNAAILHSSGVSQPAIDAYVRLYRQLMAAALSASSDSLAAQVPGLVSQWTSATDTTLLRALGIASEKDARQMAASLSGQLSGPWFRYFLGIDPRPALRQLHCKVLALNGSRDIQVLPASNLAGIRAALKKSKSKNYTVKELPGLNHLFQTCSKCTLGEYSELEETLSPIALQTINDWLDKNVK
ncbi:MAG: alpha/beta hydrolase [Chitinophagaceae bacterium]